MFIFRHSKEKCLIYFCCISTTILINTFEHKTIKNGIFGYVKISTSIYDSSVFPCWAYHRL